MADYKSNPAVFRRSFKLAVKELKLSVRNICAFKFLPFAAHYNKLIAVDFVFIEAFALCVNAEIFFSLFHDERLVFLVSIADIVVARGNEKGVNNVLPVKNAEEAVILTLEAELGEVARNYHCVKLFL